jgi:hypothetical protein
MGNTDILLDDGEVQNYVTIQAGVLMTTANDIEINAAERRSGSGDHRRALVHDFGDALTVNYSGDYPGGVNVVSAQINLRAVEQQGKDPKVPIGGAGDLLLIRNVARGALAQREGVAEETYTLWLCVGHRAGGNFWQQIQLGERVRATP